jgi:hypothetical protein
VFKNKRVQQKRTIHLTLIQYKDKMQLFSNISIRKLRTNNGKYESCKTVEHTNETMQLQKCNTFRSSALVISNKLSASYGHVALKSKN